MGSDGALINRYRYERDFLIRPITVNGGVFILGQGITFAACVMCIIVPAAYSAGDPLDPKKISTIIDPKQAAK
jgi:hypothetical protein